MAEVSLRVCVLVAAVLFGAISASAPSRSYAAEFDFKAAAKAAEGRAAPPSAGSANSAGESATDIVALEEKLDYKHRAWAQEFKQKSFEWHLLSTKIIFGLVIVIVGFGLFITYLQFRRDYTDAVYHEKHVHVEAKPAEGESAAAPVAVPAKSVTSLKLGPGGLELSSQIIGLAVLAFSLGFFYLYVKNVYPMTEVGVAATAEKAASQSGSAASK